MNYIILHDITVDLPPLFVSERVGATAAASKFSWLVSHLSAGYCLLFPPLSLSYSCYKNNKTPSLPFSTSGSSAPLPTEEQSSGWGSSLPPISLAATPTKLSKIAALFTFLNYDFTEHRQVLFHVLKEHFESIPPEKWHHSHNLFYLSGRQKCLPGICATEGAVPSSEFSTKE